MTVLGRGAVSCERGIPVCAFNKRFSGTAHQIVGLSSDDVFHETSARYRAVEPEQWLQRHPEAGSSWPSWPKASHVVNANDRFRAKREQLETFYGLLPESQGQNLALTVLCVPCSLDRGLDCLICATFAGQHT